MAGALQGSLAYRDQRQYLYYRLPKGELEAGGGEKAPDHKDQPHNTEYNELTDQDFEDYFEGK